MRIKQKRTAWNSSVTGKGLSPGSAMVKVLRLLVEGGGRYAEFPSHTLTSIDAAARRGWVREVGDELEITPAGREAYEQVVAAAGQAQ